MAIFYTSKCKHILFLTLFLHCKILLCQYNTALALSKFDPYAINNNGGKFAITNMHLDWTLGDIGNTHIYNYNNNILLSTGFLQNAYDFSAVYKQLEIFGEQIKVGPNPFSNSIHLSCAQDGMEIISIEMYNQAGICIKKIQGPYAGYNFDMLIPIEKLTFPICLMQIKYCVANQWILYKSLKLVQY